MKTPYDKLTKITNCFGHMTKMARFHCNCLNTDLLIVYFTILDCYRTVINSLTVDFKNLGLNPALVLDRLKKHNIGLQQDWRDIAVSK